MKPPFEIILYSKYTPYRYLKLDLLKGARYKLDDSFLLNKWIKILKKILVKEFIVKLLTTLEHVRSRLLQKKKLHDYNNSQNRKKLSDEVLSWQ